MTIIEKIRAKIERLKEENNNIRCDSNKAYCQGYGDAFVDLLPFLDTLESEEPNQEELEKEINRFRTIFQDECDPRVINEVAYHFAQWGAEHAKIDVTDFCKPIDPGIAQCIADHSWEMLGEDEKPVPNDPEKAAEEYAKTPFTRPYSDTPEEVITIIEPEKYAGFVAGAKWQAEQDKETIELAEDHAYHNRKLKWEIYDRDKAKEAKLKLINIDTETTLLEINLCEIPQGWTINDFLTHIIKDGIVFMERT